MRWPSYPHDESPRPHTTDEGLDHVHFTREQIDDIGFEMMRQIRDSLPAMGCTCNPVIEVTVPVCSQIAPYHHLEHCPGCRHWKVRLVESDDLVPGGVN